MYELNGDVIRTIRTFKCNFTACLYEPIEARDCIRIVNCELWMFYEYVLHALISIDSFWTWNYHNFLQDDCCNFANYRFSFRKQHRRWNDFNIFITCVVWSIFLQNEIIKFKQFHVTTILEKRISTKHQ